RLTGLKTFGWRRREDVWRRLRVAGAHCPDLTERCGRDDEDDRHDEDRDEDAEELASREGPDQAMTATVVAEARLTGRGVRGLGVRHGLHRLRLGRRGGLSADVGGGCLELLVRHQTAVLKLK